MPRYFGKIKPPKAPADPRFTWVRRNGWYYLYRNGKRVRAATYKELGVKPAKGPAPADNTPASPGGTGGGSGGGSYGSGGGGGNTGEAYKNYYTRILNIKPNMGLVQKAIKGNYTMQEFQLLVQREDTNRFINTGEGQATLENFRTLWARIFPSLGRQPTHKVLVNYLKGLPAVEDTRKGSRYGHQKLEKGVPSGKYHPGAYRNVTNPTSIRAMYAYLSQTKLFKKLYPEFKYSGFEQTLNFAGYQEYKRQFNRVYASYTGRYPARNEIGYFFRSHITPGEFEQNLRTMQTGGEAYRYATGQNVAADTAKLATYGRKGSAQTLAKVAAAYQARENYMKAQPGLWQMERESDTNRIIQRSAY